jgi:putative thioredoxin
MKDVTDATFQADVLDRSDEVPVVVDLWAPWCGPCKTLGPILEQVVGATGGTVELAKVNVDENPGVARAFQVQSIPAVFAVRGRQVVDSFVGAVPEAQVSEFVARLAPAGSEADALVQAGDEASLRRALDLEPDHPGATVALAEMLVGRGEVEEATALLDRIPESPESRRVAALARLSAGQGDGAGLPADADLEARLDGLLQRVKDDGEARQEFVDLLEAMGPEDPRTGTYRRALASRLF